MHWRDWHYVLWNVNTTRWSKEKENVREIIEIGAVKLGPDLELLSEFHTYVRPKFHPKLSEYCMRTHGVTQEMVDAAPTFVQAYNTFIPWVGVGRVRMITWGTKGKTYFMYACQMYGKPFKWQYTNINLKNHFTRVTGIENPTLRKALDHFGIAYDPSKKNALEVARLISKVFVAISKDLAFVKK